MTQRLYIRSLWVVFLACWLLLALHPYDLLGWERNHFDRVIHFLWGYLLFLPVQEWFSGGASQLRGSVRCNSCG